MKKFLPLFLIIFFCMFPALNAQYTIYGPQDEPPLGVFTEFTGTQGDNLIGTTAGKEFTFSGIDFLNQTKVYYGAVKDSVMLSLDGADFASGDTSLQEVLLFNDVLSNLDEGYLIWSGITQIPDQPGVPVYTRFVMSFTTGDTAMSLISPDSVGLDPYLGGVPDLTPGISFKVKLQFQASFNEAVGYIPHIPFYDDNSISDGLAYSSYSWGWYWENSAPILEKNLAITVDEGDSVFVNKQFVMASDIESDSLDLGFMLMNDTLPAHGMFYRNGVLLEAGDMFTSADLMSDSLTYVHDGTESTMDSIALRLYDADGAYYTVNDDTTFYFAFVITPVDDSPIVTVNMKFQIEEEAENALSDTYLLTFDSESDVSNITYTYDPNDNSDWPENGLLKKSGIPMSSGDTFTQKDINDGLVTYKHDGSETITDGFLFSVSDEFGHLAEKDDGSSSYFFEIGITLLNDNPVFTKNNATSATEWETVTIDSDHLAASDEESDNSEIVFTLISGTVLPNFGYIEVGGSEIGPGGGFTMQDLIDGEVKYIGIRNATEAVDQIVFRITDGDGGMAKDGEFTDFKHIINITQTSTKEFESDAFDFYPNPGTGLFQIQGESEIAEIKIFNALGSLVRSAQYDELNDSFLDLREEKKGLYFLKITSVSGLTQSKKLIIK